MFRIEVISSTSGDGTEAVPFASQIHADYPSIKVDDLSGIAPSLMRKEPDLRVLTVTCDQATLDLIEADQNYLVLTSEEIIK
jgi:hypothetical protein